MTQPFCVIVPTYNNSRTLGGVIDEVLATGARVIVVNDGATDGTADVLRKYEGRVEVVAYAKNRGKGYALLRGFDRAEAMGFDRVVTMDADGQHRAADLTRFAEATAMHPNALLMGQRTVEGEMPQGNTFANRLSNFWFAVQTGRRLRDTQNGFRLYPLAAMRGMRPLTSRYEAELELAVRCAWRGLPIVAVPVTVSYTPPGGRVTHFRPGRDFLRISLLNTVLTLLALVYGYPSMILRRIMRRPAKPIL